MIRGGQAASRADLEAAADHSEAEFVGNLRLAGLYAHLRYAPGCRTEVVGYKVAAALRERASGLLRRRVAGR